MSVVGDDPPRDRTGELRVLGFPTRHLGPVQMTTDTALGVTKMVVHDKSECPYDLLWYAARLKLGHGHRSTLGQDTIHCKRAVAEDTTRPC